MQLTDFSAYGINLSGLQVVSQVTHLSVENSSIKSLKEFQKLNKLIYLNLMNNEIEDPQEILNLKGNFKLKTVLLKNNPIFQPSNVANPLQFDVEELVLLHFPKVDFCLENGFELKHVETWKKVNWKNSMKQITKNIQ